MENVKTQNDQIKNLVMGTTAKFSHFRNGYMYYSVKGRDGITYMFPIYCYADSDIGNATLNAKEKGSTMMRYIRKALKNGELIEVE